MWSHIADVVPLERIWLRPALNEVFDIQWSPDSTHLVVGAIDCKVSRLPSSIPCLFILLIPSLNRFPRLRLFVWPHATLSCCRDTFRTSRVWPGTREASTWSRRARTGLAKYTRYGRNTTFFGNYFSNNPLSIIITCIGLLCS